MVQLPPLDLRNAHLVIFSGAIDISIFWTYSFGVGTASALEESLRFAVFPEKSGNIIFCCAMFRGLCWILPSSCLVSASTCSMLNGDGLGEAFSALGAVLGAFW